MPLPNSHFNKKWGSELINIITKDREIDASLQTRIESRKLFICEQHFTAENRQGELPKLNLSEKSISKPSVGRSTLTLGKRDEFLVLQELSPLPSPSPCCIYKNYSDFTQRLAKLHLGDCWEVKIHNNLTEITCSSKNYVLPKFEIFVGQDLSFSVQIFDLMLTEDHEIYSMYERSFLNVTLSNFIHQLKEFILCNGITVPESSKELNCQIHVLPQKINYNDYQLTECKPRLCQDEYYHSSTCKVLIKPGKNSCAHCH